ncbi:hypothetical protein NC652_029198 [Populus alba x Populus x berolinensis]|nr:hypothetical protein NC652_029198 [Populus alba x Populus x berolinensis]
MKWCSIAVSVALQNLQKSKGHRKKDKACDNVLIDWCFRWNALKQNSAGVSHSHVFALPITVSWASMSRSRQCFKANYSPEENLGREGVWYEINRQVMILEHVVYVLFEI